MKVTLKFYRKDPNLPSPPPGKGESGLPYPVDVEIEFLGQFVEYGGKKRKVVETITVADPEPGDPVAIVLVD